MLGFIDIRFRMEHGCNLHLDIGGAYPPIFMSQLVMPTIETSAVEKEPPTMQVITRDTLTVKCSYFRKIELFTLDDCARGRSCAPRNFRLCRFFNGSNKPGVRAD